MSKFRRHDKIKFWLDRPLPWNAVWCYVQCPMINGDWRLGKRLIARVEPFVKAPLTKPFTRKVAITWIYTGTDEQNELQMNIDTSVYPISVMGESSTRMLFTALDRRSQDDGIPYQWAVRIVDIDTEAEPFLQVVGASKPFEVDQAPQGPGREE